MRAGKRIAFVILTLTLVWLTLPSRLAPTVHATTFTVTNTGDNGGINPAPGAGTGTLRQAIIDANANSGTDTISFNIPGTGPFIIIPAANLPTISEAVIIDGYTQTGAVANTLPDGDNAVLQIFLSGNNVIPGPGLDITAGGSTIRGLVVSGFWSAPEINLRANGNNTVEGCFIGTNVDATAGVPGANVCINIDGVAGNTIGGTTPAKRNVISRGPYGVIMQNAGATGNTVLGNFIGTDRTGTANLGNSNYGVFINAGSNTIGGTASGARNVISANSEGIHIEGSVSGTIIQGNYIGLKVNGTEALGNSTGILLFNGVTNTTIGGTTAAARNIISANTTGIYLTVVNNNSIKGNYIGTDKNGSTAIGNSQSGVRVENGAANNIIGSSDSTTPGGACTGGCNLISGNNTGVNFFDTSGAGNIVISNYIGTDATGTAAISNFNNGVNVAGAGMIIGGTTAAERNIISGSINANGVTLSGGASANNIIQGNFIGTNSAGTAALGNAGWGVSANNSGTGNLIGGTTAGAGNLISGNGVGNGGGIELGGSGSTTVQGNLIGTNAAGTSAIANNPTGIRISSPNNVIGGTTSAARNILSGNIGSGVASFGGGNLTGTQVMGNYIGTNLTGTAAIPNGGDGVQFSVGSNVTIGGAASGAGNVISGNTGNGVQIIGSSGPFTVQGNFIGTQANGGIALANGMSGILLTNTTNNNIIGGIATGAGNRIAFNTLNGVRADSGLGNAIRGNAIYSNTRLGIDLAVFGDPANGVTPNDLGCPADLDTGPNNLQNFPSLNTATSSGGSTQIVGSLVSTPLTTFMVDFYASQSCDPAGNGEGEIYLGSTQVTTDSNCLANFNVALPVTVFSGFKVTATATDPNNNTSEFSPCIMATGPTQAQLITFNATAYDNGTQLEWQTGFEADNLGFNLYRDADGKRTLVNLQLVAGSALKAGSTLASGDHYIFWDCKPAKNAAYWLEDIDLRGLSTWHGPFYAKQGDGTFAAQKQGALLSELGKSQSQSEATKVVEVTSVLASKSTTKNATALPVSADSGQAVKIGVKHEGWYRVSQPELIAAGLPKEIDSHYLQLFVDGREIPILITTNKDGAFDATATVEFYGIGLDTPSSEERIYWLTLGNTQGKRISQVKGEGVSSSSSSFPQTIERLDHSIYFASLLNGEKENFFGAVVSNNIVDQQLTLTHLDTTSTESAVLDVTLQGVTVSAHRVQVHINGVSLGEISFTDQSQGEGKFKVQPSLLREGTNTVQLQSQNGPGDVNLVDSIRLTYQHTYIADNNALKLTAPGQQQITIGGFTSEKIRVFDVTDASAVQEMAGEVNRRKEDYAITVASSERSEHALLAISDEQAKHPDSLRSAGKATLKQATGADFLIISRADFFPALFALKQLHQAEGYQVALIDVESIYDEFNYGNKSPQTIKDFLSFAVKNWHLKPRFVLLVGDATYDPKNYLGFGNYDIVPTKLLDTTYLETASDDWFADFNNDGVPELSVGRLPVRTVNEATAIIAKLLRYSQQRTPSSALLVADSNDGFDFEAASDELLPLLPADMKASELKRGRLDADKAKQQLYEAIYHGQRLINYTGHGSVSLWRGNLLTAEEAGLLSNEALPVFVMMNCLNGYFQEANTDSLAEALLKAEGGAIAVWASSAMTLPNHQAQLNQQFYRLLFSEKGQAMTLGEAARKAKATISDFDVRRSWILLGDPALKLR